MLYKASANAKYSAVCFELYFLPDKLCYAPVIDDTQTNSPADRIICPTLLTDTAAE